MAVSVTLPILTLALIDLRTSSVIAISDLSVYGVVPSTSDVALQITPPGGATVNVPFIPGNVNVYKCVDLGITCGDTECTPLPDGIYAVSYSVAILAPTPVIPGVSTRNGINQKFIKIDRIKCKYQHAFLKIDLECVCHDHSWQTYMGQLRMIKLYIDGSVAACNATNYALSQQLYAKADQMLDKIGKKLPGHQWPNKPLGCNIC